MMVRSNTLKNNTIGRNEGNGLVDMRKIVNAVSPMSTVEDRSTDGKRRLSMPLSISNSTNSVLKETEQLE